jgi:uncharacterized protein
LFKSARKLPYYFGYVLIVLALWIGYMFYTDSWSIILENISVIITMAFGAFIAGSSPEGSAAIAYPVFTLLLDISPSDARNFAFAIQSIGMTAASIFIISRKIKIDWTYIKIVAISGTFGLLLGMYVVAPSVNAPIAKLSFVSLWLSFGLIMLYENFTKRRFVYDSLVQLGKSDYFLLIVAGFIGGIISSIFGTGINMLTFCILVIYYRMNEKVATPSSIIIMTIETIIGFAWHALIFKDISAKSYHMWISAIPIVIFCAPLGTYVMSKMKKTYYSYFLYTIFIVQYIGAIYVLKPDQSKLLLSIGIIGISLIFFWVLLTQRKQIIVE